MFSYIRKPITRNSFPFQTRISNVDSRKSTTTLHLIYLCGIDERTIGRFENEYATAWQGVVQIPTVQDSLKMEGKRGIRTDISLWKFDSSNYNFTIIDAPAGMTSP